MDMTPAQRLARQAIRNYLMTATLAELQRELQLRVDRNDAFSAECVRELIAECEAEGVDDAGERRAFPG